MTGETPVFIGSHLENQHGRIIDRGLGHAQNTVYYRLNAKRSFERETLQCRTLPFDPAVLGKGVFMSEVNSPKKEVLLISSQLEIYTIESCRFQS